ncbi:MAG: putative colanic acid biosynthesis acetyltransferase [Akkermansiaceae bacterium]|nr:putative colanic acid biosynthesis acetyltransferase [Akkermansiaceae bacterium]
MLKLDIHANRQEQKYSSRVLLLRVCWSLGRCIFRLTPRPCFGIRRMILRVFGAKVGKNTHIYPSVYIYFPWNFEIGDDSAVGEWAFIYSLGQITIGERVTISQRAHLCAGSHDFTSPSLPLLKPPIVIGDEVWVCADAYIGPGVTIGRGVVIGARSVVIRDVGPDLVVAGNPAVIIKRRVIIDTK